MKCGMKNVLTLLGAIVLLPVGAAAQEVSIPSTTRMINMSSGTHGGAEVGLETLGPNVEFDEVVTVDGANWVRIQFGPSELGENSFVRLTSLQDGTVQRLDADAMTEWRSASAAFNGDSVRVELLVDPSDQGVFVDIQSAIAGEELGDTTAEDAAVPESLCGADNRVPATDPRVARIRPVGCTGWLIASGELLTAGHCTDGSGNDMRFIEFDVPNSLSNGTVVNAATADQFSVDASSIRFFDDGSSGIGNDWAVFRVFSNSQTGLSAAQARGNFFRITDTISVNTVRVTGHGTDRTPPGFGGGRNSSSQTQQTDSGPFVEEDVQGPADVVVEYQADTMGGNSGGPAIDVDSGVAVAVHTNAGCSSLDGNTGTGFQNGSLMASIDQFPAPGTLFVDPGHPATDEDGSIFRPFDTLGEALAVAEEGDTISVAAGTYNEEISLDTTVTLHAPGGAVIINAPPGE